MQTDCIILGGGAGGLAAACALASSGLHVTLAERLDRVGKKLLATGNGRCNLSNREMFPERYGHAAPFVRAVYAQTPPDEVLSFFARLGLMTAEEDGRIYPRTMMSSSALDVLRAGCASKNITVLTGQEAVSLAPSRRGGWSVQLSGGEGLFAPAVIAAMGGSAAPNMGTDGSGARLLQSLGHTVTPLYPALVQLKCDHPALRSLKGIRTQAALALEIGGKIAAQDTGELLFADYGVSGVCVFQLSRHVPGALHAQKRVRLLVNLLPDLAPDAISPWLNARIAMMSGATLQSLMTGVFPRLLTQAILRQAGLSPDLLADSLTGAQRAALLDVISAFPLYSARSETVTFPSTLQALNISSMLSLRSSFFSSFDFFLPKF